jgi:hypothetical protein
MLCSGERNAEDGLGSIFDGLAGGGASSWLQEKAQTHKNGTIS